MEHNKAGIARCLQCGIEIEAATADSTFGRCGECFSRSDNSTPSTRVPIDAVVRASYFPPPFSDPLISWDTLITSDGSLIQTIKYFRAGEGPRQMEQRRGMVSLTELNNIRRALAELDRAGLRILDQEFDVTDIERISITSFEHKYKECVGLYSAEAEFEEEGISEAAMSGVRSFRRLWDAIESISPYAVRDSCKVVEF